jgi:hypothetical protein
MGPQSAGTPVANLDTAPIRSSTQFAVPVPPPERSGRPWLLLAAGLLLVAAGVGGGILIATQNADPSAGGGRPSVAPLANGGQPVTEQPQAIPAGDSEADSKESVSD